MDTGGNGKTIWESFGWLFTWGWVCFLSAWGGAIGYFHHMDKHGLKFSLCRLAIDVWTSAFVGVLTYLFCHATGITEWVTAAMVGVSGHMGARALFILERKYEKFFGAGSDTTVDLQSKEQ